MSDLLIFILIFKLLKMEKETIQKNSDEKFDKYSNKNQCSCCKCITSFCYCLCQCECHQEKIIKTKKKIIYDDLPNLKIDELRMKSLNEYDTSTLMDNTKKTLYSSRSMINVENLRIKDINGLNIDFVKERNNNKLKYLENDYKHKSIEINYNNDLEKTNKNRIIFKYNDRIKNNYNTLTDYYKTHTNFNNLRKYYKLNNNQGNDKGINNSLKSQLEFNKLLSDINNDELNNKKKNLHDKDMVYNTYIERENNFYSRKNHYEIDYSKITNTSDIFSNDEKNNKNNNNFQSEKYLDNYNKNSMDFGFNTEYNKPFRPYNFNNKSINLNEEYMHVRTDNKNLKLDKYDNPSKSNFESDLNSFSISQNGGDNQYNKENNEHKLYNNRYINKIKYDKFSSDLQLKVNNLNNTSNINITDPRDSNQNINKNKEKNNKNLHSTFPKANINTQLENNKNELLDSKDINIDNFIVTFGAKGNNEVKNIISSLKNELKSYNNEENGNSYPDDKINNIINDYEKLKKKYATNRLFTGLQNNINNLNGKINSIRENYIKNNSTKFSTSRFNLNIKGDLNRTSNEINDLKIDLREAKNKIEELTKMVKNYQKEINLLKGQITKAKKESLNISKINTINNISTSNNYSNSNKTKIGKNSFIIKIPESLLKRRINSDKQSRNNSLNDMTNSNINNQENYENNTLLDLTNNTYKKALFKNSSNNFNNISNISNNTNSNNLTNNNISNFNSNNEIYIKKITTTMKKKFRKSASQKIRINKINHNIYKKPKDSKGISKFLYTIIIKNENIKLLSFDLKKHEFNEINFIDSDNFEFDFKESFYNNKENNNNIYLNNEKNNDFFIVTGKNFDKLYKYNHETNKIKKLCTFKNNHSNGCLLFINNKIICLSGNHNKKVEMFSEQNNSLTNLPEMNIERSSFSCCLFKNEYIFALFGYNFPTQQYLDTIEFFDLSELENLMYNYININDDEWRYLNYKCNNSLDLSIKGHMCFNYFDEKIIFFGGFNGYKNEAVDSFYQLNLSENFNFEDNNEDNYIEQLDKKLNDINKNRIYYFGNNNGLLYCYNQNNIYFEAIDTNYYAHILDLNNFKHNIHYFH